MSQISVLVAFIATSASICTPAWSHDQDKWPADWLLAGEIIVTPQKSSADSNSSSGAIEQRSRARAYRKDTSSSSTTIVLPAEESEGVLSPHIGRIEEKARTNRLKARSYQSGSDASTTSPAQTGIDPGALETGSTQERARANLMRARSYSKGEGQAANTPKVGPDGIPIVVCKDDNVAGRIGDDVSSGSIIQIMQKGKPVKVRCQ